MPKNLREYFGISDIVEKILDRAQINSLHWYYLQFETKKNEIEHKYKKAYTINC